MKSQNKLYGSVELGLIRKNIKSQQYQQQQQCKFHRGHNFWQRRHPAYVAVLSNVKVRRTVWQEMQSCYRLSHSNTARTMCLLLHSQEERGGGGGGGKGWLEESVSPWKANQLLHTIKLINLAWAFTPPTKIVALLSTGAPLLFLNSFEIPPPPHHPPILALLTKSP